MRNNSFYLVPVGHKQSNSREREFRVCCTFAERQLMFGLNITQIQCLIIMNMLTKTYVNQEHDRAIKSFFCMVALFYSIEKTHNEDWEPANIIPCIVKCVQWLVDCLKLNSMPHYFMPSLNILEGRFQPSEGLCLVKVLSDVVSNIEESIRGRRVAAYTRVRS